METIPVAAIIPTRDRAESLDRTLESLGAQSHLPAEVIIVDASADSASKEVAQRFALKWAPRCSVRWLAASKAGAALQRNQGVAAAGQEFILFCDDDVLFDAECLARMWMAMRADRALGGVNAMIKNQRYHPLGMVSRLMFTLMHGRTERSFAGKVIGPAINLLPEDREHLPEIVAVEWLNLGCTIYRSEALPSPPFDSVFTGYSMMEDLALSLSVAKRGWLLANARTARIFHDSQPGEHKADVAVVSAMELANRHFVMTKIVGRRGFADHLKLCGFELFQIAGTVRQRPRDIGRILRGKLAAIRKILRVTS